MHKSTIILIVLGIALTIVGSILLAMGDSVDNKKYTASNNDVQKYEDQGQMYMIIGVLTLCPGLALIVFSLLYEMGIINGTVLNIFKPSFWAKREDTMS